MVSQLGRWTRSSRWSISSLTSSLPTTWAILATTTTSWLTSLGTGFSAWLENFSTSSHSSKCLDLLQKVSAFSLSLLLLLMLMMLLLLLLSVSGSKQQRGSEQLGHFDLVG